MSTKLFWIHADRHCVTKVDGHREFYEVTLKPVPIIARDINEAARLYYLRPDTSAWDYVTKVEEDEVDTADRIHELEAEVEELDFEDDSPFISEETLRLYEPVLAGQQENMESILRVALGRAIWR